MNYLGHPDVRAPVEERRSLIADLLLEQGFASLTEVVHASGASEATARRDLAELERQGVLMRTRGGARAVRQRTSLEEQFEIRRGRYRREKRRIGQLAAEQLTDGQTLFLNDGSSIYAFAQSILRRRFTVVTSALNVAQMLAPSGSINVLVIGGRFRETSYGTAGPVAVDVINGFHADVAVLGVDAIILEGGVYQRNIEDAAVARAMGSNASRTMILASPDKIGQSAPTRVLQWSQVDDLVSSSLPSEYQDRLPGLGVRLVLPR